MEPPSSPTRRQMMDYHTRPKSSLKIRWLVLFLVCLVMIGTYYTLDIPAALHHQLQDTMTAVSGDSSPSSSSSSLANASTQSFEVKFNLLFSLYSIPNTILPLFGGSCVDRSGASRALLSFGSLALIGQILVTIGGYTSSWPIMLLGRFVYGLGGENICVASSTVLNDWFDGGEVALAFAISLATGRLGSVMNNIVSPVVANSISTSAALGVGALVNLLALIAAIIIGYVERKEEKRCSRRAIGDMLNASLLAEAHLEEEPDADHSIDYSHDDLVQIVGEDTTHIHDDDGDNRVHLSALCSFGALFCLLSLSCMVVYGCVLPFNNVASAILLERNYFTDPPDDCTLKYPEQCTVGTLLLNETDNPSTDSNGSSCPLPYDRYAPILPTSLNVTRDSNDTEEAAWKQSSYIFSNLTSSDVDCEDSFWADSCTSNYCSRQSQATITAGRVMSIPYTISAILSPLMGFAVDKIGGRAIIATLASIMLVAVHTTLALRTDSPVLPLIGQGVAYSLYAAVLWPSVPLTVRPRLTGTAFGTIMAIQNIGLTVFPMIIAAIHNRSEGHYVPNVEWFFVGCASCGTVAGLVLNIIDAFTGRKLNSRKPKQEGVSDGGEDTTNIFGPEGAGLELDVSSLVSHSTL